MYRQMRMWRHDYRNHLQTMKALDTPIKSGNAMADAILSSKMSLAQAHGIDVRVDAHTHIPIKLRISELDLCCVLGNLFDNAIEANDGLPEADRMIRVYMDMKDTQLYISFTNASSGGKQRKVGGRFRTIKSDEGHGFGLVHIDQIIEAAGGYLSRNSEDGASTTETAKLIKKSPTDSERKITFDPIARPQVSALLTTAGLVTGRDPKDIAAEIGDAGAGALKAYVIESVNEFLAPHRERRAELAQDMDSIRDILHDGNARANAIAEETLDQVREAMGMKY